MSCIRTLLSRSIWVMQGGCFKRNYIHVKLSYWQTESVEVNNLTIDERSPSDTLWRISPLQKIILFMFLFIDDHRTSDNIVYESFLKIHFGRNWEHSQCRVRKEILMTMALLDTRLSIASQKSLAAWKLIHLLILRSIWTVSFRNDIKQTICLFEK